MGSGYPDLRPTSALPTGDVLVVDDDPVQRSGLRLVLQQCGYRVTTAASGHAALAAVCEHMPDIIVADVNMDDGDGLEMTRQLRELAAGRDLPIILISGKADVDRRIDGLDAGADDFMAKPIDPNELLARVRTHLRRAERTQTLVLRSTHDDLTGALNRGAIVDELRRELKRANRTGTPLSLMMVDVEDFKAINDAYGHGTGDQVLARIARALERTLRTTDSVGRFGGDEFVLVLPDLGDRSTGALVQRLRRVWARQELPLVMRSRRVGLSIGVATSLEGDSIEALVRRADDAMYRDKRQRKSRRPCLTVV
jgi:diguanylate cyclase (GGDEF)-like protein